LLFIDSDACFTHSADNVFKGKRQTIHLNDIRTQASGN
jgi:hypothetical protein